MRWGRLFFGLLLLVGAGISFSINQTSLGIFFLVIVFVLYLFSKYRPEVKK